MRIYRVQHAYDLDGNDAFGRLIPTSESTIRDRHDSFGIGKPASQCWADSDSLVERFEGSALGNFPAFLPGSLVADRHATSELESILVDAGQLFPLKTLDGETFTLINLCPLSDCVDPEMSKWKSLPSGKALSISHYEFDISRLPKVSLFKIKLRPVELFATEGYLSPQSEFINRVSELELTGIRFREVWNDEGSPVKPSSLLEDVFRSEGQ